MATKREVELELQLWHANTESVQNGLAALNAQAQLLQMKGKECAENVARLTDELDKMNAAEKSAAEAAARAAASGHELAAPVGQMAESTS